MVFNAQVTMMVISGWTQKAKQDIKLMYKQITLSVIDSENEVGFFFAKYIQWEIYFLKEDDKNQEGFILNCKSSLDPVLV